GRTVARPPDRMPRWRPAIRAWGGAGARRPHGGGGAGIEGGGDQRRSRRRRSGGRSGGHGRPGRQHMALPALILRGESSGADSLRYAGANGAGTPRRRSGAHARCVVRNVPSFGGSRPSTRMAVLAASRAQFGGESNALSTVL